MRAKTNLFKINGSPLFAPDADMELSYEDLDASDSGRDESGVMHRIVVRYKVGSWQFEYSHITQAEYEYMLSVLPDSGEFTFTHPKRKNPSQTETTKAYCSKYSIVWRSAVTGDYRNFKFKIIEC